MRSVQVRKLPLHNVAGDDDLKDKNPEQLLGMMWQLTLDAWSLKENLNAEPRLQRHVVVLTRRSS